MSRLDPELGRADRRWRSAAPHLAGWSLLVVGLGQLVSGAVGGLRSSGDADVLVASGVVVLVVALVLIRTTSVPSRVSALGAFRAVTVVWAAVCVAGAVPFWVAGTFPHWDDALFESVSGFTATGSTVLSDIQATSSGLLFWRQLTQWIGSIGFVVLALAVLPLLGIGGMELLRAETPGPGSDRLAPRLAGTARRLSGIYLGLTALIVVGFLMVGMDLYDAVSHSLTALATGGFSPYNASIGHFDSQAVEVVAIGAMFLGSVNFVLFYNALRWRSPQVFWRSGEFRFFVGVTVCSILFIATVLSIDGYGQRSIRDAAFNVVSLVSSCGFGTADYARWAAAPQLLLLFLMVTGGMAGSTSGALKLFRVQVVLSVARRELKRVRHPRGVFAIRHDGRPLDEAVVTNIVGYVLLYFVVSALGIVVLAVLGVDLATGSGSVVTAMGGVGPGLAETGPASNFLTISRPARGILDLLMLLGRLEILPVLLAGSALARSSGLEVSGRVSRTG